MSLGGLNPYGQQKSFAEMTAEEQGEAGAQAMVNFMQSCPGKTVAAGVMGFGLGGIFGIFMSSMSYDTAMGVTEAARISHLPFKQQMKMQFSDMFKRSYSSARNFGKVGGIYSGVECCVESLRAKDDMYNSIGAGAITGGALAIKGGPTGMAIGAVGFALFSFAIETYLRSDNRLPPNTDADW
nr:Tim22 [Starmerella bombicola]